MPTYKDLVNMYSKRQKDTLVDSVSLGLSYADNVAVDFGLMEESGLLDAVTAAVPFAVIAMTEEMKVILGKKTGKAGFSDALQRMLKTGAAMTVGAAAAAVTGVTLTAIPAAAGTRMLLKHYRSRAMLASRVQDRINRLRALHTQQYDEVVTVICPEQAVIE